MLTVKELLREYTDPYKSIVTTQAFEMGENRRFKQRVFKFKEKPADDVIAALKDIYHPRFGSVAVQNLDPELLDSLRSSTQPTQLLKSLLRVKVTQDELPDVESLPDVFGHYQVADGGIQFIPNFPFEGGMQYFATFDPRPLNQTEFPEVLKLVFSLPEQRNWADVRTEVTNIFPSSDCLSENLLRLYVHFSNPIQRGWSEEHIKLLGPDGLAVPDVL